MARMTALDPMLGRVLVPGRHDKGGVLYTVDEDGGRTTTPSLGEGRAEGAAPETWLFGCSWTFGSGEPDETTFACLLQSRLPALRIRNYGVPGYGTVHNLLDLQRRTANTRPAGVVFVYGDFHWKRNVPPLDFVRKFTTGEDRGITHFQRARLDRHGRLSIDIIEIPPEQAGLKAGFDPRLVDPDEFTQVQATIRLIEAAAEHCRGLGAAFTLAHLTAPKDPVPKALRRSGINVLDLSAALTATPVETRWNAAKHPSAPLHRIYADLLHPVLAAPAAAA